MSVFYPWAEHTVTSNHPCHEHSSKPLAYPKCSGWVPLLLDGRTQGFPVYTGSHWMSPPPSACTMTFAAQAAATSPVISVIVRQARDSLLGP